MKRLYSQLLFILFVIGINHQSQAQGCVAIRGLSGCGTTSGGGAILMPGESQFGVNFRYFQSFRHFRGDIEEKERVAMGTEVINDSYFSDFSYTYAFANRFYANIVLPFVYHERSSMYEHGGNSLGERHTTYSGGLADMRISAGYWLFPEDKYPGKNISMALGVKLPTGKYDAEGKFYNQGPDAETITRPVDQSIQPGDGGFGLTVEMQAFHQIGAKIVLNSGFYYLITPQEHNGVRRSPNSDPYAVPDQYAARLGMSYSTPVKGLEAYLGGRMECVPVNDLIGSSDAYRRPGYVISSEPGVNYSRNNLILNLSVPLALYRNRTQSYLDKQRERETGQPRHGDAAFADYLINIGVAYRFHKKDMKMDVFKGSE